MTTNMQTGSSEYQFEPEQRTYHEPCLRSVSGAYVIELLLPQAEAGCAEAQYMLGAMYEKNAGVPKDSVTALHWFRQSAASGFEAASHKLAGTK